MRSRIIALGLVFFLGVLPAVATASGRVNCFIYHRFDEPGLPTTNIAGKVFQSQLNFLKELNYSVLSLGQVVQRLLAGDALPERGTALSVDDAFTSFVEIAMPILRSSGFPVTLFVNTDSVGSPGYLDWDQLRELLKEGVEIGNHTATHDYLVEMRGGENLAGWRERVRQDILKAQAAFEQHLGIRPVLFAYPYGEFTPELIEIVAELGFLAAFAQQSGVIYSGVNRFVLPRFPMGGPFATLAGFKDKLSMGPIRVAEERPFSPLVGARNPPELQLRIEDFGLDLRRINCFVQGDNLCKVEALPGQKGWFRVVAEQPLSGRRNKFTLTAQDKKGNWYWYSHLWVKGNSPVPNGKSGPQPEIGRGKAGEAILLNQ